MRTLTILAIILAFGLVGCTTKITTESPGCTARASAGGGGGGNAGSEGAGGAGASGGGADSEAACTPSKTSIEQAKALGSGFLPSQ